MDWYGIVTFEGFGIQQSNDEAAEGVSEDARDVDRCSNCVTLNKEILAKHRQWAEQEQAIKAAHEKEVTVLHKQLKQERDKCDKLEKELLLARRTIENVSSPSQTPEGPVVAQTLQRIISGE